MKDDPELQMDDAWSDGGAYSPKRRRVGAVNGKPLRILVIILLVFIVAGGIYYLLSKPPGGGDQGPLQSKVFVLEQKIAGLEKQLAELRGKIGTPGPDPALLQRVDALTQKVEALEKQEHRAAEPKAKPSAPPKPAAATEKQYHTVQKGETLLGISKKYSISVEQLRKLNNLSADKPLRIGQKLQVSSGRSS